MATHARRRRQVVIIVDVAISTSARRHSVQSGQSEARRGVIELAISPLNRVVALLAGGRESGVRYRSGGVIVIGLVTADARDIGDVVVVVDVAIGTLPRRNGMGSGERESRLGVIECRGLPRCSVMADIACLREAASHVVGIRGSLEILEMAGNASAAGQVVVIIRVAIGTGARRNGMGTGQREVDAGVVEGCRRPTCGGVAGVACCCEIQGLVIRIGCALEILQVAADTGRVIEGVVAVDVTIGTGARRHGVLPGEREARAVVIKGRVHPVAGVVALGASLREIRADVVRIRCALKILKVAADASGAAQVVVATSVTIRALAGRHSVLARECKSRDGVVELGVRPLHGIMAVLAGGRETVVRHRRGRRRKVLLMT